MGIFSSIAAVAGKALPFVSKALPFVGGLLDKSKSKSYNYGLTARVNEAKALGIHPLAAIGIPPYSNIQNKVFSQMGQNLSSAFQKDSPIDKRYKEALINTETAKAQYYRSKSNEGIPGQSTLNTNLNSNAPIPGIVGQDSSQLTPGVNYAPVEIPVSKSVGVQAGTPPLEQHAVTKYGTVYKIPTQLTQEAISEGSLITQLRYNLGQVADYLSGYANVMFPKNTHKLGKILGSDRPQANPGNEYRYNVFRGAFVLRKIGKEGTQFWDHKKLYRYPRMKKAH